LNIPKAKGAKCTVHLLNEKIYNTCALIVGVNLAVENGEGEVAYRMRIAEQLPVSNF